MAHFVDRYREQIAQLAGAKEFGRASRDAFDEFRNASQRSCERAGILNTSVIDPEAANELLRDIHSKIVENLETLAKGYSSVRWLFMLRRLPRNVFEGQLISTRGYDSALAEVLAARSRLIEQIRSQDSSLYFHIDGNCVRLPSVEPTEDLREAVQIYDRRCENERSAWSAAGTVSCEAGGGAECILVADKMLPQHFQLPDENTIDGIASPRLISLTDIRKLTEDAARVAGTPWPRESAIAIWIARAAWFYFVRRHRALPLIRQIFNTGYLLISDEIAEEWVAEVATDCNQFVRDAVGHSPDVNSLVDLLAVAKKDRGEVWPLWPRDLIRTLPGAVCVDLCAASYSIQDSLEYIEETGTIANVRSQHFEAAVQKMIDGTSWRPEGETRKLIGLKLRKAKRAITDIDAVGISGTTLLLVSCKSRLKSRQYDIGKYSVVRNAAAAMAVAQTEWKSVVSDILSGPGEFNWDFMRYSKIVGVVCTSSVFYAPLSVMTVDSADGIPIKGLNELRAWLDTPAD